MTTTTTTDLADVPHPAGAVHVAEWYDTQPGPYQARRYFRGSTWVVKCESDDDIAIEIDGTQGAGGDVARHIMVLEGDYERMELSSSDHARQFARALLAAADEWDQMATYDSITTESLEGLQACMVELVDELLGRGVGVEEVCRRAGASGLDELWCLLGKDAAQR